MSVRVAVVGGGVSGLTAAYALRRALGAEALVEVFEATDRLGGLLHTPLIGGLPVDVGAEAFIVRRPEASALVAELGLAEHVCAPGPLRPALWSGDGLHPLPTPAVMGIPTGPGSLGDLVDERVRATITDEALRDWSWDPGTPISVGALVRDRFGDEVVARSVDPMLGGVYSARADQLGLVETIPGLARALDAGAPSLTAAVTGLSVAAAQNSGPVFGALRGGYRTLVEALRAASGALVRIGARVVAIDADGPGYTVTDADGAAASYDAVIVAVPPWQAGPMLTSVAADAAAALSAVQAAGSAVVACVLAPGAVLPDHSGVLVATDADLAMKAVTLSTQKWPHLAEAGPPVLRVSFGRLGEPVTMTDDLLVAAALADLERVFAAAGLPAPVPESVAVQRWPTGLPHFAPGHLAAMATALDQLPVGVALAGAAVDGVGVPACIGAARRAAGRIVAGLTEG
ncbi:protoporphyrinogen oxidase [Gordonia alkaliphila]|uniref:protoporphyrinogen oxidase n=1 Tax=Gordonia alkaliphila TaxID=1053547 RepID=UPI001FF157F0|nr:protoporphyrinogen oxidase [Gordonia alkaliphila]MCK0440503.1 protoporphyrinogen oxidase [Gordonia alkaliphila]